MKNTFQPTMIENTNEFRRKKSKKKPPDRGHIKRDPTLELIYCERIRRENYVRVRDPDRERDRVRVDRDDVKTNVQQSTVTNIDQSQIHQSSITVNQSFQYHSNLCMCDLCCMDAAHDIQTKTENQFIKLALYPIQIHVPVVQPSTATNIDQNSITVNQTNQQTNVDVNSHVRVHQRSPTQIKSTNVPTVQSSTGASIKPTQSKVEPTIASTNGSTVSKSARVRVPDC
jgi:hypothetical protein